MKIIKFYLISIFVWYSYFIHALEDPFQPIIGSPFPTGSQPTSIAFSPEISGNLFAAVANLSSGSLSVYRVNTITGSFTQVPSSPVSIEGQPSSVAFSPEVSGNLFAAVLNQEDNGVFVYKVNTITGAFTQVEGSPFPTGNDTANVAFSSEVLGELLAAVTNQVDNTVSVYKVNTITGVFTQVPGSPFATGNNPNGIAFSPETCGSLFAAVTNQNDSTVSVYNVDFRPCAPAAFTPVPGSPFSTGNTPVGVAFSPLVSGILLAAVTNFFGNTVSMYDVDLATGAFTPLSGSPFSTGDNPGSVAFSPEVSGDLFVAVTNKLDNTLSAYNVNINFCSLVPLSVTPLADSPFPTGNNPVDVAFTPETSGNVFAAVVNEQDNTVSAYAVIQAPGSIIPSSSSEIIMPPRHFKGFQKINKKNNPVIFVNILKWKAPLEGALVVKYQIYRNHLFNLIGVVQNQKPLKFKDCRKKEKNYVYYIVSIDQFGNKSIPIKLKIRDKKN